MNNAPVAWMSSVGGEFIYVGYEPAEGYLAIPLYTHPAKTLNRDEVEEVFWEWIKESDYKNLGLYEFRNIASAILRKAQEK